MLRILPNHQNAFFLTSHAFSSIMVQHTEKSEHIEAFEAYYALDKDRSLEKLHAQLSDLLPNMTRKPSYFTLKNWSRWFDWQRRVILRDKAIAKSLNKKVIEDAAKLKAKWLKQTEARIATAFDSNGVPKFDIKDSKSLNETVRLALQLLGEPEHSEIEAIEQIRIIRVGRSRDEEESE